MAKPLLCVVQAPEMVRVPLEELVLQIHLLKLGPAGTFLQQVLEPPPVKSVVGAVAQLQALGALTEQEQLTPLGESAQQHCVLDCQPLQAPQLRLVHHAGLFTEQDLLSALGRTKSSAFWGPSDCMQLTPLCCHSGLPDRPQRRLLAASPVQPGTLNAAWLPARMALTE